MRMSLSEDDEFDRRRRLVLLAYQVVRDMKMPDDATDVEGLSLLSRAFSDMATKLEAPEPKGREDKPPSTLLYAAPGNGRTPRGSRSFL
jgi:hypothetical protein